MVDVNSLVNSILADDGYNALSDNIKNKLDQFLLNPTTSRNEIGTNTSCETRNLPEIDFDMLNNSNSIREAKFVELQLKKEIEAVNEQFQNTLKKKHELMLHNDSLLKNLHDAEVRERKTKVDNGILQLKIDSLTESLFECTNKFSNLQTKYHKKINDLKPDLDEKNAEVLALKNDVNVLQIKSKNQEDIISIMKREIDDLNVIYANETEKTNKELTNNQALMNHYKECYKNEVEQTKKLTMNIMENKDHESILKSNINDIEKKFSTLSNDHQQYKIDSEHTICVLRSKLNASEEIVKQILHVNPDVPNYLIHKGTTITDVYAIYKETCSSLQNTTLELERYKRNFNILEEQIRNDAPKVGQMEKDLSESNEKVKRLCDTISRLKLKLKDANNELEMSNTKCDQLSKDNKKLHSIEDDLSKQVCFLLRNNQCNTRYENRNVGMDMSPQSIISNNYVTFENIQGLQKLNKKLLEIIRSFSKANDEQDIQLIKELKDEIKILKDKLETKAQLIDQQAEKISKMQSLELKSKITTQNNDEAKIKVLSPDKTTLENEDDINVRKKEHLEYFSLVCELNAANCTIKQLKEKLESNSVAGSRLDQHIQELNHQINELQKKIKISNIRLSENEENIDNLHSKILSLETENHEVKIEIDKIKNQCNILKKDNDSMYISNINYSCELRQKTEFQTEFKKTLTSQLNSLIINWNFTLTYIAETEYDKVKFKEEYKKLTKTLKDVRDTLLLKLEAVDELSTFKEISRSRTNSFSLRTDEYSNFHSVVDKLKQEVKNLKSKLKESDQLKNQLKSELNVTKQLYKSLEQNLKKMCEYSSQLENEREMKKKEYLKKDQQLNLAMQELSEFILSQNDNINKLQNILLLYEQKYCKMLKELEGVKDYSDDLLINISKLNNIIFTADEEFKKSVSEKDRLDKELNHKRLDSLEFLNATKSAEIDHLKNQKIAIEKSCGEIKEMHNIQLNNLDNEINCFNETIKRWQFENELLSEQFKIITFELLDQEQLNNSKISDKEDSFNNTSLCTNSIDKRFMKMANLINILKDKKNSTILEFDEKIAECNKLKSDLHYKSKVVDGMQTQMNELRQLHTSSLVMNNDHSNILEKIEFDNQIVKKSKMLEKENVLLSNQLKELQELDAKKTAEICALNDDISRMQCEIDQKCAEVKAFTSTGPDKLAIEPPTGKIKPLEPAVNKPQPVHQSITLAAAETPLASIKPTVIMQPRSVVVLSTSQTSSTSSQSSTSGTSSSVTVHPQQPQSIHISSSVGNVFDSLEANSTAAPSVTAAQANPAISIDLVVPQGREQVQTTLSQPTTVSVSTVSPSQSQIDRYSLQNENGQAMESNNSDIASSSAPDPSIESEPSVGTVCTSEPSCFSLDTTTYSNSSQRKRKADHLMTSYMKRFKSFMPREENRGEIECEAPTSSQGYSEVSNSYIGPESNSQDSNKEVETSTYIMVVTSEATDENNEIDLTSQECTADTNNMNEINDIQNEKTELITGENILEYSSNAEATAMAIVEEDSLKIIHFQEFQNTPVSATGFEETKTTDNVTSDAESRQNESDSTSIEHQAGPSRDALNTVGVSQSTEIVEKYTLDLRQKTVEIVSSENEEDAIGIKSIYDIEGTQNDDIPDQDYGQEIISVSSSSSKDNEAVPKESPIAGPSGMTSDSSANGRKPITWNELS